MNIFRRPKGDGRSEGFVRAEIPHVRTEGSVATMRLYDPIDSYGGYWGVSAKEFTTALDDLDPSIAEIRLLINSPGGEVHEGIAIMNALRAHPARVVAVVEGIAASSASFIAASADELVMMRNSELFIHNAWTIIMGDAVDLRAAADELEKYFDRNIASVYAEKSGMDVEHWLDEMHKDRFFTAEEAVSEGLADRIEGEGDAASARARFNLSVLDRSERHFAPAASAGPKLPSSSEPGEPNRKENAVAYSDLTAGLRERLGVTVADASDEMLLAALDQVLAEQAETPTMSVGVLETPVGTVLIDAVALEELRTNAALGAEARSEQTSARRESIIQDAINDGRITPAHRDSWRAQLETNEEGTTALLATLAKNTVPVREIGHSDKANDADEQLYAAAFSKTKEA